jgi:hypothetical protein
LNATYMLADAKVEKLYVFSKSQSYRTILERYKHIFLKYL